MSSQIIDISKYAPIDNKKTYCLDTNVLYWYCYHRSNNGLAKGRRDDIQIYYDFVDRLVQNGNPIITSIYNVSEFLNVIEKHECDIYKKINPEIPVVVKDLRNMPKQRKQLHKFMRVSLNNVIANCQIVGSKIQTSALEAFVDELEVHKCDVFDYVILKEHISNNRLNIITDDSDFCTIEDITIYTANEQMLSKQK